MIQGKEYRICTICEVHHYENCETCFGYGIKKKIFGIQDKNIPISSNDAKMIRELVISGFTLMWDCCPECHSSPYGLPKGIEID